MTILFPRSWDIELLRLAKLVVLLDYIGLIVEKHANQAFKFCSLKLGEIAPSLVCN